MIVFHRAQNAVITGGMFSTDATAKVVFLILHNTKLTDVATEVQLAGSLLQNDMTDGVPPAYASAAHTSYVT